MFGEWPPPRTGEGVNSCKLKTYGKNGDKVEGAERAAFHSIEEFDVLSP